MAGLQTAHSIMSPEKTKLLNPLLASDPWGGKILWRREWLPTPVFLPGEFHGQRSLVGYSPWGHKESDMTEQRTLSLFSASNIKMPRVWAEDPNSCVFSQVI